AQVPDRPDAHHRTGGSVADGADVLELVDHGAGAGGRVVTGRGGDGGVVGPHRVVRGGGRHGGVVGRGRGHRGGVEGVVDPGADVGEVGVDRVGVGAGEGQAAHGAGLHPQGQRRPLVEVLRGDVGGDVVADRADDLGVALQQGHRLGLVDDGGD